MLASVRGGWSINLLSEDCLSDCSGFAGRAMPLYANEKGFRLSNSALFMSGSLFTTDYLVEAVTATPAYIAVDVEALRSRLCEVAAAFPQSHRTNESQTEDDFIWPVLAALGWSARCASKISPSRLVCQSWFGGNAGGDCGP